MTAEAYVQRFIDLISKIDAKAEECVTTGEKIHRFRQGLRPSLRGRLEIDSTTGDRFKDFGRLIDVCIKVDDTHRGVQVASLAGGDNVSQAGPSSSAWPNLAQAHQKRSWADSTFNDDGSNRSAPTVRGRGSPGVSRGKSTGRQSTQGRGFAAPSVQPGTGRYGDFPWRPQWLRTQLIKEGKCLKCEQSGHIAANCRNAAYSSQDSTQRTNQGPNRQGS